MNTEHKSNTATEIKDLWQTPEFIFNYYDKRFGFNLDIAASEDNSLCEYYIDEDQDALSKETICEFIDDDGYSPLTVNKKKVAIWCNPPYSDIMPWVSRCVNIANDYRVPVVMLIPADTSVKWFKAAFRNCTECHLISGRLSFINAETKKPVSGNNKGSVVFIFDPKSPVKQSVHLIDRDSMK